MPETYVVHLGNSKELMDVAEDNVAKRVLREHVRESLGVTNEDIVFALINSMLLPVGDCFHVYPLAVDLHISRNLLIALSDLILCI